MGQYHKRAGAFAGRGLDPLTLEVIESFRNAGYFDRMMFGRASGIERAGHPGRAFMLLALGNVEEGITQREVAGILHVSPPAVTVMLQKMEAEGVIERWTDEADQRLTRIRLTPDGQAAAEGISSKYRALVDASIGKMSETDRTELARLLRLYADNIQAAMAEK